MNQDLLKLLEDCQSLVSELLDAFYHDDRPLVKDLEGKLNCKLIRAIRSLGDET